MKSMMLAAVSMLALCACTTSADMAVADNPAPAAQATPAAAADTTPSYGAWGVDTSRILRTGHDDGERWQPYLLPDAADVVDFDLNDAALCVIREGADVACSDLLPPDVPRHGRHRGQLVRVPGLPELPADFADEPTGDVSAVDAGAI